MICLYFLFFLLTSSFLALSEAENDIPTVINADFPEMTVNFDPIFSNYVSNYYFFHLIYEVPIRVDTIGQYRSSLLENFRYFSHSQTLQLCLKQNRFFSDGAQITLDDLAFSVMRVMFFYPFLVNIREIKGLNKWRSLTFPLENLPEALTLDHKKNCLNIAYEKEQLNPFYFFTVSHHGIIPKKVVNIKTGLLLEPSQRAPFSGPYSLSYLSEDELLLQKREGVARKSDPLNIRINVVTPDKIGPFLKKSNKNMVIAVGKLSLSPEDRKYLEDHFRGTVPTEAGAEGVLFNISKNSLFADKRLRQFFAEQIRLSVEEIGGRPSKSFFGLLQPGYESSFELKKLIPEFTSEEKDYFLKKIRTHPPSAGFYSTGYFFQKVYEKTAERLKIEKRKIQCSSRSELSEKFISGTLDMRAFQILMEGFNVSEGTRMIFSPGYVPFLLHLHHNQDLQEAIKKFSDNNVLTGNDFTLKQFNRILFEDAAFAIFRNFGREYYVRKESKLNFSGQIVRQDSLRFFENKGEEW